MYFQKNFGFSLILQANILLLLFFAALILFLISLILSILFWTFCYFKFLLTNFNVLLWIMLSLQFLVKLGGLEFVWEDVGFEHLESL